SPSVLARARCAHAARTDGLLGGPGKGSAGHRGGQGEARRAGSARIATRGSRTAPGPTQGEFARSTTGTWLTQFVYALTLLFPPPSVRALHLQRECTKCPTSSRHVLQQ